jgi:hypothetical protein
VVVGAEGAAPLPPKTGSSRGPDVADMPSGFDATGAAAGASVFVSVAAVVSAATGFGSAATGSVVVGAALGVGSESLAAVVASAGAAGSGTGASVQNQRFVCSIELEIKGTGARQELALFSQVGEDIVVFSAQRKIIPSSRRALSLSP